MSRFLAFLNRMDASAWRTVAVTLGLFLVVGIILVVGKFALLSGASGDGVFSQIEATLTTLQDHPLGLPAVILFFCAMAFLGAPQFGLIAAAVVAFGPSKGFLYAWVATLCSATLTFWIGRWAGEGMLRRYGGETANRLSRFVGKNDFFASMIVRNVPTAPFIVVNMAFGVSHAVFWRFLAGLAIGVLPKTALVAFGGGAVTAALAGAPVVAGLAVLAVVVIWIGIVLFARNRMRAGRKPDQDDATSEPG